MYIHPIQHKGKEEVILAMQARGWLFESHYWMEEQYPRKCQWCGQEAEIDMTMAGGGDPTLCPGNPGVKDLVSTLHELADIMAGVLLRGQDPEVDSFTLQPARAVLKQHGVEL